MHFTHYVQCAGAAIFVSLSRHAEAHGNQLHDWCSVNANCKSECCGTLKFLPECVQKGVVNLFGPCFTQDGCDCVGNLYCDGGKCKECKTDFDCPFDKRICCPHGNCAASFFDCGKCGNSLLGIQFGDVCCGSDCGTCGGAGCGGRPGGPDNCCSGTIMNSGVMCSDTQAAPCIIDNESMCDNGLPGIQTDDICCDADCGACGGVGCGRLPGGSASCCSGTIRASGMMCDITNEAPCIVNAPASTPTPDPTEEPTGDPTEVPVPGCSNGLSGVQSGVICCEAQCGSCGGAGCGRLPGGQDGCCTGVIESTGTLCSIAMAAPCIVDN